MPAMTGTAYKVFGPEKEPWKGTSSGLDGAWPPRAGKGLMAAHVNRLAGDGGPV